MNSILVWYLGRKLKWRRKRNLIRRQTSSLFTFPRMTSCRYLPPSLPLCPGLNAKNGPSEPSPPPPHTPYRQWWAWPEEEDQTVLTCLLQAAILWIETLEQRLTSLLKRTTMPCFPEREEGERREVKERERERFHSCKSHNWRSAVRITYIEYIITKFQWALQLSVQLFLTSHPKLIFLYVSSIPFSLFYATTPTLGRNEMPVTL